MYKLEHFDKKLCASIYSQCSDNCGVYSIWKFCPWRRWHWQSLKESLVSFFGDMTFCCPDWFVLVYWLSLGLSLLGIVYSVSELWTIYQGSWTLTTVHKEEYQVIPLVFRRNARLVGVALMIKTWSGLFVGIATATPSPISTWLAIYFATIFLELILWMGTIFFGSGKLDFRTFCLHVLPFGAFFLVRCVRDVFIREIERRANVEELKLLPKLAKRW